MSEVTTVRTYLMRCKPLSTPGRRGLTGRNESSTDGSSSMPRRIRRASTACPPRMSSEAATTSTRKGRATVSGRAASTLFRLFPPLSIIFPVRPHLPRPTRELSSILLPHLLDLARVHRAGLREQPVVEAFRAGQLRLARKFLLDDAAATLSHLSRARGVFEQRDDALGHRRVVPDLNEVARLALDDGLARAAHIRRDDRARRRHVFENRVGEPFGLRA